MFSTKSIVVGSLFFLSAVSGAAIKRSGTSSLSSRSWFTITKLFRALSGIDDANSALSNAISDLSSVNSLATPYVSSAFNDASSYAGDHTSVGASYASSALSVAQSAVSSHQSGDVNTQLTGWVTGTFTLFSSIDTTTDGCWCSCERRYADDY